MKIIIALIIFSAIILFHELGHFLLAKANHIVVTEFSLGMGPRLISFKKGTTRYSLKLLPFGGSCAMLGEDTEDDQPGSFLAAPVWGRILVVVAGPVFNFILAFALSLIIVGATGSDEPVVGYVQENSGAYAAGLREGDRIVSYQGYSVDLSRDVSMYAYFHPLTEETTIRLAIERGGKEESLAFSPQVDKRYLLGFMRSDESSMTVESLIEGMPLEEAGLQSGDVITEVNGTKTPDGEAYNAYLAEHPLGDEEISIVYERDGESHTTVITPREYKSVSSGFQESSGLFKERGLGIVKYAFLEVRYMIRTTLLTLKGLFTGLVSIQDMSGPVGVVDAIGSTYEATKSSGPLIQWMSLLSLAVLLSANLGVMNLLPIPALDGGRLLFLLVEAVRRKPGNRQLEAVVNFTGLMLLLVLMVFIMYQDIAKIVM